MKANEGDGLRTLVDVDLGGRIIPARIEGHVLEAMENPEGYLVELLIREATETEDGDFEAARLRPRGIRGDPPWPGQLTPATELTGADLRTRTFR